VRSRSAPGGENPPQIYLPLSAGSDNPYFVIKISNPMSTSWMSTFWKLA
jgi:hypothetical protein